MKTYPSIPRIKKNLNPDKPLYTFAKIDGSNLRAEWQVKKGWTKFGTRTQLLDESNLIFGSAIPIFKFSLADPLEKIFFKRWPSATVYFEFWGENSFAGSHDPKDIKKLTLFDVAPFKEGIMGPKDYQKYFGNLEIAPFLGIHTWDHIFLREVANSKLSGMSFEGVVGKCGTRHNLEMYKVKSRAWREKVVERYSLQYLQNLEDQDTGIDL